MYVYDLCHYLSGGSGKFLLWVNLSAGSFMVGVRGGGGFGVVLI